MKRSEYRQLEKLISSMELDHLVELWYNVQIGKKDFSRGPLACIHLVTEAVNEGEKDVERTLSDQLIADALNKSDN